MAASAQQLIMGTGQRRGMLGLQILAHKGKAGWLHKSASTATFRYGVLPWTVQRLHKLE